MWEQVRQALNESATRVITGMANLLPGFVALLLALIAAAVVGWLLAFLLKRFLRGIDFDGRVKRMGLDGLTEWAPRQSPTLLVARTAAWLVILLGFMIGVTAFDAALTSELALRLFQFVPDMIAAVLVMTVGMVLARFVARGVLIAAVNRNLHHAALLSMGVKWLVLVLAAAMALEHLGIGGRIVQLAFGLLFGGIVLTLSLAIGLGSKDMVSRSLERQAAKPAEEEVEPFRHL
jgi:uncharacterized membrane protein